jgi:hypothetical protein
MLGRETRIQAEGGESHGDVGAPRGRPDAGMAGVEGGHEARPYVPGALAQCAKPSGPRMAFVGGQGTRDMGHGIRGYGPASTNLVSFRLAT